MSRLLLLGLLLLGVASAQNDALSVSVKPSFPGGGGGIIGAPPCPPERLACTNVFPTRCFCTGPKPVPDPIPLPDPGPIGPFPLPIGPFPRPCSCFTLFDPVCGSDGRTYSNSCQARCGGAKVECEQRCPCPKPPPGGCICPAIFAPVCGKNGKTFSNSCAAGCDGVDIECNGECPCPGSSPPSTPSDINKFLDECVEKGTLASVAAARAACGVVTNKCPARPPPRLAFGAASASLARDSRPNPADALLEKVLEGACLKEAENACKSKAFDNIKNSDCRKIVTSGPARSVPGCSSVKDAVNIFTGEVNKLCRSK